MTVTRCRVPRCLGHAQERTEEVACARCGGLRWVLLPAAEPIPARYVCARCRAALAGAHAIDPSAEGASPAQCAARAAGAQRLKKADSASQETPGR
jgi:DNA-directed RNA polymerase subunit RPC12/RpoP